MPRLRFPPNRIIGTLDFPGSWSADRGPVLATGEVDVPEGSKVTLSIEPVSGVRPLGGGSWAIEPGTAPVDLGFVRDLPANFLQALFVRAVDETTFGALRFLAPGLTRLYLAGSDLSDAVLPTVAALTGLTYLQTYGNRFTDAAIQQLASLTQLEQLYLEEQTLSSWAFDFVTQLPYLARLGLQDVALTDDEIRHLRSRLPGVDVG